MTPREGPRAAAAAVIGGAPGGRLRRTLAALATVLAVLAATALPMVAPGRALAQSRPGESTLPAAEWTAIQSVVRGQLEALRAGDGARAFGYASPAVRARYGNAGAFMEMVRRGFLPLLTARYDEFLDGAVIGGNVVQPLRLIQPDNTVEVALYTMERQRDGQWRIVGCAVVPSTVKAA
jgi:hypothetical protein